MGSKIKAKQNYVLTMGAKVEVLPSGLLDFLIFPVDEGRKITAKGEVQKGLLVVLGEAAAPELMGFLAKILGAVGFDLSADALTVQLSEDQKIGFSKLAKAHAIRHVLCFGVQPPQMQLNFNAPPYHPFTVNEISFLFADQLSSIQANQNLKRPLWEGLKSMFEK
jgi:hypothetical protein